MRTNSIARFTATALIVAAVILFILGMLPVIAVAIGGLGAGWATGSRLWIVAPLACCVCSGAMLLLAFGAMLLVLTRIQGNLNGWRRSQAEAAATRAATVPPQEIAPAALATAAVAAEPLAAPEAEAGGEVAVVAESAPEAAEIAGGAALAGAGIAAAVVAEEEEPAAYPESAPEPEPGAPSVEITESEEIPPVAEEPGGPGLAAALAGAGVAAVALHEGEPEAAPTTAAEEEAAAAAERHAGVPGIAGGAALAGAGIAAAAVLGGGEEEAAPEPVAIPESTPGPEAGEPSVEIMEAAQPLAGAEGTIGAGAAVAVAAAGLAAVVHEGEQEDVTIETTVLEPDSPEVGTVAAAAVAAETVAPEPQAPAAPARTTAWAYDEGTSKVTRAVAAGHVQGVGQVYAGKLKELGITTTASLLRAGATPKGRKELAEKTGISPKQILKWVNHVDLARIKGISEQYADLLEWAGVDTVPELAQRNADNLLQKMVQVNEARRLVRRLPTLGMVASWISQAKELPRVVVYK